MMNKLEVELTETAKWEDDEEDSSGNYESALGKAIAYWNSGCIIPMSLAVELMAAGYDLGDLEARHLKV